MRALPDLEGLSPDADLDAAIANAADVLKEKFPTRMGTPRSGY